MELNPYADRHEANAYFQYRLGTQKWDAASEDDQNAALQMASDDIDKLPLRGFRRSTTQLRRFPRDYAPDDLVPEAVKFATCELALEYLKGVDPHKEYELLTRREMVYATIREQRHATRVEPHVVAGIPSLRAFNLMVPFLRDERSARLVRKS